MAGTELTILNSMAGADFEAALEAHLEWGLRVLDLKDGIFGRGVMDLGDEEAHRASGMISERGLSVWCLSTHLFSGVIESGPEEFARESIDRVDRAIELGGILGAKMIRLLAAQTERRPELADSHEYIRAQHPWLHDLYRKASGRIIAAGLDVTIENEVGRTIFSTPDEILGFYEDLDCGGVGFTWDVQNLWQMGIFPTVEIYEALRPLICYLHLKGGMSRSEGGPLEWASSLEDASWPIVEITSRVVSDGVSPVICLNPSHGARRDGYDYDGIVRRDIEFIRASVRGVEA